MDSTLVLQFSFLTSKLFLSLCAAAGLFLVKAEAC
jgi:hypothetical protein